jgi:hypothetical protein
MCIAVSAIGTRAAIKLRQARRHHLELRQRPRRAIKKLRAGSEAAVRVAARIEEPIVTHGPACMILIRM